MSFDKKEFKRNVASVAYAPLFTVGIILIACLGPIFANKLFDMFGVNHGPERLCPLPWCL